MIFSALYPPHQAFFNNSLGVSAPWTNNKNKKLIIYNKYAADGYYLVSFALVFGAKQCFGGYYLAITLYAFVLSRVHDVPQTHALT